MEGSEDNKSNMPQKQLSASIAEMTAELQTFLNFLQYEKRYSEHTIIAYHTDLNQFFNFLEREYTDTSLKEVSAPMIKTWMVELKNRSQHQVVNKSIHRKISSLKSFYKYLLRKGTVKTSPLTTIILPKLNKRLPSFLKESEAAALTTSIQMEGLLTNPGNPESKTHHTALQPNQSKEKTDIKILEKTYWNRFTEYLILRLFYECGLRRSELVSLKESDIDISNQQLKVLGKGNKERILPMSADLLVQVQTYIKEKSIYIKAYESQLEIKAKELLTGQNGKPLYAKKVYNIVRARLAEVTDLKKKSPHILRHSFATHLLNAGADLNAVKELLGHASLAATQVYTHTNIEKLKEVYNRAHPKS